jgi:hypothetical protein
MITYICSECGEPCELITVDHGGIEEIWGAMIWHEQPTDITDCCNSEDYEETNQ